MPLPRRCDRLLRLAFDLPHRFRMRFPQRKPLPALSMLQLLPKAPKHFRASPDRPTDLSQFATELPPSPEAPQHSMAVFRQPLPLSLLMDPGLSPEAPCPSHLRVDQSVRSLLCATARRTGKSYDSAGCWKDEPLGAQPLTSEAKENLRSIVLKGSFDKPSFEFFQVP